MSQSIRVVAAVVDTRQLTLYKDDGESLVILQGDQRLKPIVEYLTPRLMNAHQGLPVELDFSSFAVNENNPYRSQEEASGGVVKFFRVARKLLLNILGGTEIVASQSLGEIPEPVPVSEQDTKLLSAVDQIMAQAEPMDAAQIASAAETVVAVVHGQAIAGVEQLERHLSHAQQHESSAGMTEFLKRMASVIDKRRHSMDDLLKFMSQGDMPVALDGSIIAYKILRRRRDGYVDCHTGKVPQKVGSLVCMDPSLVDHDRRVECSNGLHVARRQYLGNFPGDVVTLIKIAPEDVIAVPKYDPNKMRVCGYHILFELPNEAFQRLKNNQPIEDEVSKSMLARAISGNHPLVLEEVRITEQYGGGVVVTPRVTETSKPKKPKAVFSQTAEPVPDIIPENSAPVLDPTGIAQAVSEAKAETRGAKAERLWREFNKARGQKNRELTAQALMDFKKASKKGWSALGLPDNAAVALETVLGKRKDN